MNKFEKQLEKWNNGVLRGAQAKLAKALKVSTATTALWVTGKRHPSKGYVAQMANLFHLDTYGVLKLFSSSSASYPLPATDIPIHTLHEKITSYKATESETPSVLDNIVKIPLLLTIPETNLNYPEEYILEWWSLPRRHVQGAKYILYSQAIGLPDATSEYDLCFIKPCKKFKESQWIVLTDKKSHFCAAQTFILKKKIQYKICTLKYQKSKNKWFPVGILVRRFRPF